MKTRLLFILLLLACSLQLFAQSQVSNLQSQIVGTWKMTSQKGTDPNGTDLSSDMAKFQQYKIITSTHWMYLYYDADSTKGSGDYGTYTLTGNKYVEALTGGYKTDFTLKVEGDKLYQDGAVILPDGKKGILHEVYERVAEPANTNSDIVGTWEMTSYTLARDGKKAEEKGLSEMEIITPTHTMWLDKKEGEFWTGMLSSYTRQGNKIISKPIIASFPIDAKTKEDITITPKGDQLNIVAKVTMGDGKVEDWMMNYKKVGKAKLAKAVSTNKP